MTACIAVIESAIISLIAFGIFLCCMYAPNSAAIGNYLGSEYLMMKCIMLVPQVGSAVAVVWIVSWLSGIWRPEPSWIDRAGRILGAFWIFNRVIIAWTF
jgi:hypothetical protein